MVFPCQRRWRGWVMLQSLRSHLFVVFIKTLQRFCLKKHFFYWKVYILMIRNQNSLVVSGSHTTGILPTFLLSDYRHKCNLRVGNMITSIYIQIAVIDKFTRIHCLWLTLLYYHLFNCWGLHYSFVYDTRVVKLKIYLIFHLLTFWIL